MENLNASENAIEKKKWIDYKRAPATHHQVVAGHALRKHFDRVQSERKAKWNESKQHTTPYSQTIKIVSKHIARERERRIRARNEYQARKLRKGPQTLNNPRYMSDLGDEARLNAFNRRHKCSCHGLRFNRVVKTLQKCKAETDGKWDEKKASKCSCSEYYSKDRYLDHKAVDECHAQFRFECDRDQHPETIQYERKLYQPFERVVENRPLCCRNCQRYTVYPVNREHCWCRIEMCEFCKFQVYYDNNKESVTCICGYDASQRHNEAMIKEFSKMKIVKRETWNTRASRRLFLQSLKGKREEAKAQVLNLNEFPELKRESFSAHGGAMSMVEIAKDAILASIGKIADGFKQFKDYFVICAAKMVAPVGRILNRAQANLKAKYESQQRFFGNCSRMIDFFNRSFEIFDDIYSYLKQNACLLPSILISLHALLTQEFGAWWLAHLASLVGIFTQTALNDKFRTYYNYVQDVFNAIRIARENETVVEHSFNVREEGGSRRSHMEAHSFELSAISLFFSHFAPKGFATMWFMNATRTFNTLWQGKRNFMDLMTHMAKVFPKMLGYFAKASDTGHILKDELNKEESPLRQLAQTALEISAAKNMDASEADLMILQANFTTTYNTCVSYMKLNHIPNDTSVATFLNKMQEMATVRGLKAKEHEPFVIRLTGDAGVGKSSLTFPILSAIAPEGEDLERLKANTYVRNPSSEFWDGCTKNKQYLVYDDFNQNRDEIDLKELILLCTRAEFMPPFSSNSSSDRNVTGTKGDSVNFKAIVINSNSREIVPVTLNSKEAINRRKHLMFDLTFIEPANITGARRKVKKDWSHLKIKHMIDFNEIGWSANGKEAIKKMLATVHEHYNKFIEEQNEISTNIEELMFRKDFIAHSGRADLFFYSAIALKVMNEVASNIVTAVAALICTDFIIDSFNYGKWLTKFLLGITLVVGVFALFRLIVEAIDKTTKDREAHSGENKSQALKFRITSKNSGEAEKEEVKMVAHNGEHKLISNNVVTMVISLPNMSMRFMNGIFVEGTACLFNRHLFYDCNGTSNLLSEGTPMTVYSPRRAPQTTRFDPKRLIDIKESDGTFRDLVIYHFPPAQSWQARTSIVKHFWDGDRFIKNRSIVGCIMSVGGMTMHHGKVTEDRIETSIKFAASEDYVKVHELMEVSIPSKPGLCGSVVALDDESLQNKIVGINVGSPRPGHMAVLIVTRPMLERALTSLNETMINFKRRDPQLEAHGNDLQEWRPTSQEEYEDSGIEGEILHLYKSNYLALPSKKTKIVKSPIHNMVVQAETKPCVLSGGRDKLMENMNKYSEASLPFDPQVAKQAVDSIREELDAIETIRLERALTIKEAINGVEGYPYLTSMDLTTSAGFPMVGKGLKGEKRQFFIGEVPNLEPCAELAKQIDVIEKCIADHTLPDFPYTNTLKDERKDNADVDNGKVRMFSMASVALAIVMRRYFLPRVAHFYQCRHSTFLTIGMDKTGREWDNFVRRMLEVGDQFHDADYKKFDTRANFVVRMQVNRLFMESWMSEEERKAATTLLHFDSQGMHQVLDNIVVIPSGTSSGSMLTAIAGSLINETYVRCAWLECMPTGLSDLHHYRTYVRTKNYGDDFVMTVHPKLSAYFGAEVVAEYLARFNITMTAGDKTAEFRTKTVKEFTFLRNTTGKFMGRYVPLAWNPLEQINWIRIGDKAEEPETACENNCNSALRAVFFYGDKSFKEAREAILRVRPTYNLVNFMPLYEEFMQTGMMIDVNGTFTFGVHNMPVQTILDKTIDPVVQVCEEMAPSFFMRDNGLPPQWNLILARQDVIDMTCRTVQHNEDDFGIKNMVGVINDLLKYREITSRDALSSHALDALMQFWTHIDVRQQNVLTMVRLADRIISMTYGLYFDLDCRDDEPNEEMKFFTPHEEWDIVDEPWDV